MSPAGRWCQAKSLETRRGKPARQRRRPKRNPLKTQGRPGEAAAGHGPAPTRVFINLGGLAAHDKIVCATNFRKKPIVLKNATIRRSDWAGPVDFCALLCVRILGGLRPPWLVAGGWRFSLSVWGHFGMGSGGTFWRFRTVTARPTSLRKWGRAGSLVSVLRAAVSGPKPRLADRSV